MFSSDVCLSVCLSVRSRPVNQTSFCAKCIGVQCGAYGTRSPHFLEWGYSIPYFSDTGGIIFDAKSLI